MHYGPEKPRIQVKILGNSLVLLLIRVREREHLFNIVGLMQTRTAGFIRCDYLVGTYCSFSFVEWTDIRQTDGRTFLCHL